MRMTNDVRIKPVLYAAIIVMTASWVFTGCTRSNLPLGTAGSASGRGTIEGYIYAPPTLPNGDANSILEIEAGLITFNHLDSGQHFETYVRRVADDPTIPDHPSASAPYDRERLGYYRMQVPAGSYCNPTMYMEFMIVPNGTTGVWYEGPACPFSVFVETTTKVTTILAYQ